MLTSTAEPAAAGTWQRVETGDDTVAVAQRAALGTSARVAVWPSGNLDRALIAVDTILGELDLQASRFRPDSEISWINEAMGSLFMLSDGLAQAIGVALAAARWTGGLADPTVGTALVSLGYEHDFAAINRDRQEPVPPPLPAPGWQSVKLADFMLRRPRGVLLDLGATAKGLGSDRAVRAAIAAGERPGGVLVSLGGDIAIAGTAPHGGWPITVADTNAAPTGRAPRRGTEGDATPPTGLTQAGPPPAQLVRLSAGAIATSSITCRTWRRAGRALHHIVDPRTGHPADGPWRMASVAASTCADANAAATAAIVAGDRAEEWLTGTGLPGRLVGCDGCVRYVGGWPQANGGQVAAPPGTHVYGGTVWLGGSR
jgi:thiamine biosynthesis lipoprotein